MNPAKLAATAVALAILPLAARAQDAAPAGAAAQIVIAPGASVTGNDGNPIGTIAEASADAVVVDTGLHQIPLPRDAFGQGETGLTLNITKTALEATFAEQMAAAEAQLNALLVAGTPVMTADAQTLGTIDTLAGQDVIVALPSAEKLALGKDVFAVDAGGGLMVRVTKAQIDEAVASNAAQTQS